MFKIYGVFVVAYIFVVALAPAQFLSADNADISVTVAAIQCNDGLDNDSDGHTDYPDDPGCDSALDTDETDPPLCGDNICNGIESCSSCSLDCGVCTTTTANTSGGGGGGGIVIVPNTPTVQETQTDSGEAAGEQTRAVARMVASVSSSITTALNTLVTQLSQFVARMQQDTVRTAQVPEVPDEPVETSLIIDTESLRTFESTEAPTAPRIDTPRGVSIAVESSMFETVATALEAAATTLTTMLGQLMRPPEATLEAIAVGQPAAAVATQVTVVAEETSDETPAPPVWRWRSFEVLGYWLRGLIGAGWLW